MWGGWELGELGVATGGVQAIRNGKSLLDCEVFSGRTRIEGEAQVRSFVNMKIVNPKILITISRLGEWRECRMRAVVRA